MILNDILDSKRREVAALRRRIFLEYLAARVGECPAMRDVQAALRGVEGVAIIAEIKPASPSAGEFHHGRGVAEAARLYEEGGAAALSVVTDTPFFQGHLDNVTQARAVVSCPILRKDFMIDEAQVYESRLAGADAVLLIAAALDAERMQALLHLSHRLGMACLVEVHHAAELQWVLPLEPPIIGINNRNLADFSVDLKTSVTLRPRIPPQTLVVSESGIRTPDDIKRLRAVGINAFLVGEALMRAEDPASLLRELRQAGEPQA